MKYLIVFFFVLVSYQIQSQATRNDDFRLGFGIKLSAEIQNTKQLSFRASATGGIGQYIKINDNGFGTLPTAHIGVLLYNKGILGSQLNTKFKKCVFLDFFTNFTLTSGGKNITNNNRLDDRRVPLYHFSDFTSNPLQNTFKHSVSFGSNIIFNPHKYRNTQSIGFFNLNVARTAQISYYNDGGPILKYLGDKKDRYYTGGLVLSAHFNTNTEFSLVELSFHKFTGWQPYAFDLSDKLQMDYIPYKNEAVFGFNQQRWKLSLTSDKNNYTVFVNAYDVDVWDVQDILHFNRDNPFHPDYFYAFRIAPGISYSSFNSTNN